MLTPSELIVTPLWSRYSCADSSKSAALRYFPVLNRVSMSLSRPCSPRDVVEHIASSAQVPVPVASLSEQLATDNLPRGYTGLGPIGDLLDSIAESYDGMVWWISDDGLHMAVREPKSSVLRDFDEFAGRLTAAHSNNRHLSKAALLHIAEAIDAKGFMLKEQLQPTPRQMVAAYNQKYTHKPIKTFHAAAGHPRFARHIRRRLYLARDRYEKSRIGVFFQG